MNYSDTIKKIERTDVIRAIATMIHRCYAQFKTCATMKQNKVLEWEHYLYCQEQLKIREMIIMEDTLYNDHLEEGNWVPGYGKKINCPKPL